MTKILSDLQNSVWIEPSKELNGVLKFQSLNEDLRNSELLDKFSTLSDWTKLKELESLISSLGLSYNFVGESKDRIEFLQLVLSKKFEIDTPFTREFEFYPFQHIGMNLAYLSRSSLLQWDTGSGKSTGAAHVAQKLFDEDEIDICFLFCKRNKKWDWERFFEEYTRLSVRRIDGGRQWRHDEYRKLDSQVYIFNYERARDGRLKTRKGRKPKNYVPEYDYSRTDILELAKMIEGKRALFIYDEAQQFGNYNNLVSNGIRYLLYGKSNRKDLRKASENDVRQIALTATPYRTSPYNYRNIFHVLSPGTRKVSGEDDEFEKEYVDLWNHTRFGRTPQRWKNLEKLGKRIESHTHIAMKSDPAIAAQFPEVTEPSAISLELSDQDALLYDFISGKALSDWDDNTFTANRSNFMLMRMICNTPEALLHSTSNIAEEVRAHPKLKGLLTTKYSTKFEAVEDLALSIVEQDQKIVLFTQWTNGTLFPYLSLLKKRHVDLPIFGYWGVGMSDHERDRAIREFTEVSKGAIFFSSDAGQDGLNLYAPYLAHIDMPHTYSTYKQRSDRIHRSDSLRHGVDKIWIYRFLMSGTVEQRTHNKVWERRRQAEIIQGTSQTETIEEKLSKEELRSLMFGLSKNL